MVRIPQSMCCLNRGIIQKKNAFNIEGSEENVNIGRAILYRRNSD